ncbi:alpha/beta hydrolase [Rhizobium halophytocola]|uniref:alpha/beta hydrolase n=1 Tax=Rhizobium halophytocola TaxID=735519 RepID=UPI001AEB5805
MQACILFVQGAGEGTYADWDDKLVASLRRELGPSLEVRYPPMPGEDDPDFAAWSAALAAEIRRLGRPCVVVGHSIGGTVAVHALAARPELLEGIGALFLIAAPYVGDGGWPSDDITVEIGWAEPLRHLPVFLYHGDADDTVPAEHLDLYLADIPHAAIRRLPGRDHQLSNDLAEVASEILGLEA